MSKYPESERVTSMFENASKSGGSYFTGKLGGDKPINILPGQRITLVKTSKVASNGAPIWSLLLDPMGADDQHRVYENRSTVDLANPQKQAHNRQDFIPVDPEIPF